MKRAFILFLVLVTALAGLVPLAAQAKASPLGSVRAIRHGLSVQPPHHKASHGKVKQKLYSADHLATKHSQLASLSFKDGSTLHINQNTDLTLRSAHATDVKSGEVDVIDNGGHHQILTAVATASAIGTEYDVKVTVAKGGKVTVIVTVVSGTVMVTTKKGSQQLNAGQQVTVTADGTISQPVSVDAAAVVAWTSVLPAPLAPSGPTPTATGTATSPTPTPTSTPPAPATTPTSAPATLFTYSFGGINASWTPPNPPGGNEAIAITQATGCGTTTSAAFSIAITYSGTVFNSSAAIHSTWVFANPMQSGGSRYIDNTTLTGEIDFFLTMHGADTSAPTVTMAPQIQGNISGYTPGTVSVPVTKTAVTSCP